MAVTVTLHVETVKTMTCVTKGMVPVLMGVRVTGRESGVTVSMKYCKNTNCIETDTGLERLDSFFTVSALQTISFIHKTHIVSCNCKNIALSNFFYLILR